MEPMPSSQRPTRSGPHSSDHESYLVVALVGLAVFTTLALGALRYADSLEVRAVQVESRIETVYDVSVAETDRYPRLERGRVRLEDGRSCYYELRRPSQTNPYGLALTCDSGPRPALRELPALQPQG